MFPSCGEAISNPGNDSVLRKAAGTTCKLKIVLRYQGSLHESDCNWPTTIAHQSRIVAKQLTSRSSSTSLVPGAGASSTTITANPNHFIGTEVQSQWSQSYGSSTPMVNGTRLGQQLLTGASPTTYRKLINEPQILPD